MNLTSHAVERMTERNFSRATVDAIISFGAVKFVNGAESLMLDKQALGLIADEDYALAKRLERYRGSYVVIGDSGKIVTVARRYRRLKQ